MAKKIDKNEITKEMVQKALKCKTADELLKLAPSDFEVNLSDRYAKKSIGIGFV